MAAEDAHKTAIITLVGLHKYKMMPFGLRNSSNTYQQYIDQVTRNLPFCFAYVDDIFVASHAMAQHEQHLRLLLDRFKQSGVVLNKEKCEIAVTNLTFLGHHISAKGFKPVQQKVHTIKTFPKPLTMKQLRRFLGMVNFYRPFIPNCTNTIQPLNKMLSPSKNSKKKIQWSVEAVSAFLKSKLKLSNATLLSFPVPNTEIAIFVDSSVSRCDAVLQ